MDVLPVEPGRMATVVLETHDEVFDYSCGVDLIPRLFLRLSANVLGNFPMVHTVSLTELDLFTGRLFKKAEREYSRGLLPSAERLQATATQLSSFIKRQGTG